MFSQNQMRLANRTSRGKEAVGLRAVVPRYVRRNVPKDSLILDFGAGKSALHTRRLIKDGWNDVTAWEFGENFNPEIHNESALRCWYDVVFASNVLNVQSSIVMLRSTLRQIHHVCIDHSIFIFNYPSDPRKICLSERGLVSEVLCFFAEVDKKERGIWVAQKPLGNPTTW